jgi:hypothetical protein
MKPTSTMALEKISGLGSPNLDSRSLRISALMNEKLVGHGIDRQETTATGAPNHNLFGSTLGKEFVINEFRFTFYLTFVQRRCCFGKFVGREEKRIFELDTSFYCLNDARNQRRQHKHQNTLIRKVHFTVRGEGRSYVIFEFYWVQFRLPRNIVLARYTTCQPKCSHRLYLK